MRSALLTALEAALGAKVERATSLHGGDINEAYRIELVDKRRLFVKTNVQTLPGMFACEARGLAWLAEAGALRTPEVAAARDADDGGSFLALELIESRSRARDYDERFGRGLAALHRTPAAGFGFEHDNYIASLTQSNAAAADWPAFYFERRLEPLWKRALDRGILRPDLQRDFARLGARIQALCGPAEPPARLHGDLWGGNAIADEHGLPVLIDPAVYGGHREIDLAMMQLFGGFGPACFSAYDELFPRASGHEQRVALYQLYPLLVHLNLFGGSYLGALERALATLV